MDINRNMKLFMLYDCVIRVHSPIFYNYIVNSISEKDITLHS